MKEIPYLQILSKMNFLKSAVEIIWHLIKFQVGMEFGR